MILVKKSSRRYHEEGAPARRNPLRRWPATESAKSGGLGSLRCCEDLCRDNCISPEGACQYTAGRKAGQIRGKPRFPPKTHGVEWGLRLGLGSAVCGAAALLAHRLGALTASGAGTATALGVVLFVGGGWGWLALVGGFFPTAPLMTAWEP